jgi:hypothetical protein
LERRSASLALVTGIAASAFVLGSLFYELGHPLLWHDESETAMFASRVLDYGYPKIHGERNVLYSLWHANGVGIHEPTDAYTGSPWGQYYVGALGVGLGPRADLYARTAWVRAPFALAGAAGLLWLALTAWPLFGPERTARWTGAALYASALAYSVNLLLHLREARYYGLAMLAIAGTLWLWQRREREVGLSLWGECALAGVLVALFHTFHPAFGALGTALALRVGAESWRRGGDLDDRARHFLRASRPLLAAAALALPTLLFFDFLDQTRGWLERFADTRTPARNLGFVGWTLARYEFGLAALVLRVCVAAFAPGNVAPERRRFATTLATVVVVYAFVVAQIPFLFERYFVVLGPLVSLMVVLDGRTLWEAARGARPARRRGLIGGLVLASLAVALAFAARMPEFVAYVGAFGETYRGPLDFVIPYLDAEYEDPSKLIIATNYEGPAYMFYLGSQVTVGFYGAALERDRQIQPDVIVPRPWPDHVALLKELSERVPYRAKSFPVQNLPWNNNPALSPRADHATAHRFRTATPRDGAPELVILELQAARNPRRPARRAWSR